MSDTNDNNQAAQTDANNAPKVSIKRVYVKDLSFESPNSPASFSLTEPPNISVEINSKSNPLENELYETVLHITVKAMLDDNTVYIAEVQQAGCFHLANIPDQTSGQVLGSFCPTVLFPYARTTLDQLVISGGYPALMLAPINFDALYAQKQMQQEQTPQQ